MIIHFFSKAFVFLSVKYNKISNAGNFLMKKPVCVSKWISDCWWYGMKRLSIEWMNDMNSTEFVSMKEMSLNRSNLDKSIKIVIVHTCIYSSENELLL